MINENDTTATDEITFGDNDFLAALVAALLNARLLVLLTNTDGVFTADPRSDPGAELMADRRFLRARRDRDRRGLGARQRRHGEEDHRGADRQRVGGAGGDLQRDAGGGADRGGGRRGDRDALHRAGRGASLALQAVAEIRQAADRVGAGRRGRGGAAARERVEPARGRRHRRRRQLRARGRRLGGRARNRAAARQGDLEFSSGDVARTTGHRSAYIREHFPDAPERSSIGTASCCSSAICAI